MGTKFAPVHATLVIGYLEEILYDKMNVKYGIQFTNEFVKKLETIFRRLLYSMDKIKARTIRF